MLNIGINSNNNCGKAPHQILSNIKATGFKNVMIAFKTEHAEDLLKDAKEQKLNIPFVHLHTTGNLWVENSKEIENLKRQIMLAGEFDVPVAVLHATSDGPIDLRTKSKLIGLKQIEGLVNFAQREGVNIAIENLDFPSFWQFEFIMKKIQAPALGFCYDVGHHQLLFPEINLLEKYGDRLMALHIHDNYMDYKEGICWKRDLHLLPFDGKINFDKIIKDLAKCGYKGTVMLEVHKQKRESLLYSEMSDLRFLAEAKKRAEKLALMLENELNLLTQKEI